VKAVVGFVADGDHVINHALRFADFLGQKGNLLIVLDVFAVLNAQVVPGAQNRFVGIDTGHAKGAE